MKDDIRVVAEFMGWTVGHMHGVPILWDTNKNPHVASTIVFNDWNAIMPVCKKAFEVGFKQTELGGDGLPTDRTSNINKATRGAEDAIYKFDIDRTFREVVKLIKILNSPLTGTELPITT